jgi:hypothetical protein
MEAKMKIYDHKYMEFQINDGRVDFIWRAETEGMSDYEFQYSILRYASFVMEHKPKNILIDLTNLKFNPSEESGQFHSDYVTKIFNMAGVRKKVFVAPSMENQIIGKEPGTDYENAFMKSNDEAVNWLNS